MSTAAGESDRNRAYALPSKIEQYFLGIDNVYLYSKNKKARSFISILWCPQPFDDFHNLELLSFLYIGSKPYCSTIW
jgi:hypothetical protein